MKIYYKLIKLATTFKIGRKHVCYEFFLKVFVFQPRPTTFSHRLKYLGLLYLAELLDSYC